MLRTLLLAVVMVLSAAESLAADVPYVEYSSRYKTLEFFYADEDKLNQTNTWKVLPSSLDYVGAFGDKSKPWEYFPWYQFRDEVETVVFDDSFNDYNSLADTDYMFYGFTALKTVKKLWNIKLSARGASMRHMFDGCTSLTDVQVDNSSNEYILNCQRVVNLSYMFSGCTALKSITLDFCDQSTATTPVITLDGMFEGCTSLETINMRRIDNLLKNASSMSDFCSGCTSLKSIKLYGDSSKSQDGMNNGVNMYSAFKGCTSLESIDMGSVRWYADNVASMFKGCSGLTDASIGGLRLNSGAGMSSMFEGCTRLSTLDLSKLSSILRFGDMDNMFKDCMNLVSVTFGSGFSARGTTTMRGMFSGCRELTSLDLSMVSAESVTVTDMRDMFRDCQHLSTVKFGSGLSTGNVTNMSGMFYGCQNLTDLDVSGFDTKSVTDMSYMFYGCRSLATLDVSGFDTQNVTSMAYLFHGMWHVAALDVAGFDTRKVTDMNHMFAICSDLNSLTFGPDFSTALVENMNSMFYGCEALQSLDVSGFDTRKVTNMESMFDGCEALPTLDVSGFDTHEVTNMRSMFSDCYNLTSLDLTNFNTAKVTNMESMFYMSEQGALLTTIYATGKFSTAALATPSENMFRRCTALKGAVAFDAGKLDASMANYATGYFTVPYKLGGTPHPLTVAEDGTLTCGRLVLDGENEATRNFTAYEPFTATEGAEYSRMLPYATYWGSVCLPFAFNTADCSSHTTVTGMSPYTGTFTFYDISSLNDAKDVLTLTKVEGAVEAGRPLLYHTDRNLQQLMTIKTPNAPTAVVTAPVDGQVRSGIYLTGTFTDRQMPDEAYALGSNRFRAVSDYQKDGREVWSRGLYAYMMPSETAGALAATISFDDSEATAIGSAATVDPSDPAALLNAAANGTAEIYDLDGRRLSSLQKGVNVVKLGTVTKKIVLR